MLHRDRKLTVSVRTANERSLSGCKERMTGGPELLRDMMKPMTRNWELTSEGDYSSWIGVNRSYFSRRSEPTRKTLSSRDSPTRYPWLTTCNGRVEETRNQGLPVKVLALIGSLASNSMFYSLVGLGKPNTAWIRGGLLGLAMGIGAVTLPGTVGVKEDATIGSRAAKIRAVSWYVLGGLLAALAAHRKESGWSARV
jgi:hypothetical protein